MKQEFKKTEWEPLVDMLRDEVQENGALLNLLADQQEKILGRDSDGITSIVKDINAQLDHNYEIQAKRSQYVNSLANRVGLGQGVPTKDLIPFMPKNVQELFSALVDELADLFIRSQQKAGQNQMLLMRATEAIEQIIRSVKPEAANKTYTAKGVFDFGNTSSKGSVQASV